MSFTQVLVSEVWEEELWGLEANRPSQGLDSWERSGQGSGPFLQAPSRGLWCPVEQRGPLRPIKLPRLVLGLVASVASAGSAALVASVA